MNPACFICLQPIILNPATLRLSCGVSVPVHGLCCAKEPERFELVDDYAYSLRPEVREVCHL